MECPIGLSKVHCENCHFWRNGKCDYDKVMQEWEMADARRRRVPNSENLTIRK